MLTTEDNKLIEELSNLMYLTNLLKKYARDEDSKWVELTLNDIYEAECSILLLILHQSKS